MPPPARRKRSEKRSRGKAAAAESPPRRGGTRSGQLGEPSQRAAKAGYADLAARPLYALVFVLPMLILFEVGAAAYLVAPASGGEGGGGGGAWGGGGGGVRTTIKAEKILSDVLGSLGAAGLIVPALLLVTILITQHIARRDPLRLRPGVFPLMAVESLAWALPMLVLAALMHDLQSRGGGGLFQIAPTLRPDWLLAGVPAGGGGGGGGGGEGLMAAPWQARATVALGAGLYEELLFRLILIALLHLALADGLGLKDGAAGVLCVLISAAAFALYHDPRLPAEWPRVAFHFAAGVYFAVLYLTRGFGIAAGGHAAYDLIVLLGP